MKNKKLKLIALVFVFFFVGSIILVEDSPTKTLTIVPVEQYEPAAEEWSRDFDDGNFSDWTVFAIDDGVPYNEYPGNFTAEDGSLRSSGEHFNIAIQNSSVAYGTWSFDVYVVDQPIDHEIVIPFILIEYNKELYLKQAYFFQIVTGMYRGDPQPRVQIGKMRLSDNPEGRAVNWFDHFPSDDIWGWKHFTITREDTNQFYVYMNGSLVLGFKDGEHTTCNYFGFSTRAGPAIDNIVVSDSVDYDAAPPEWTQDPTDQVIDLGQDFRYDLNATDHSGVEDWWLNDTTNFVIDYNGIITNSVDLEFGTYALNVSVDDTLGFTQSAVFTVSVQIPDSPDFVLYAVIGGAAIVIIALVVLFMKKRG